MNSLIVGCGYLGQQLAELLQADGHAVHAVTRSATRASEWRRRNWTPIVADVMSPESLWPLPECDVLYYAVGYNSAAGVSRQELSVDGLRNVLTAMTGRCRCLVYVSSTSVYAQSDGEEIDESSAFEPVTENGRVCLEAENCLRSWHEGAGRATQVVILRLAGIYGPGRLLARTESLRAGEPLSGRADAWLNLIHRDDAARLAFRCSQEGRNGGVYLGCDDEPVCRVDFYSRLAELVNAPAPRFDESAAGGGRASSRGLNKCCRNTRIRDELGFRCEFPTWREGLAHAIQQERQTDPAAERGV